LQGVEQLGRVVGCAGAEDGLGEVAVGGVAAQLQAGVERAAATIRMRGCGSHLPSVSQPGCQGEGAQYSNGKPKVPVYRPGDNSVQGCG
jgi:hypothetical protein